MAKEKCINCPSITNFIPNLYASDSQFDDRNREHEDRHESNEVRDKSGGKVEQVERDVEQLISGAHAEQNLENEVKSGYPHREKIQKSNQQFRHF